MEGWSGAVMEEREQRSVAGPHIARTSQLYPEGVTFTFNLLTAVLWRVIASRCKITEGNMTNNK